VRCRPVDAADNLYVVDQWNHRIQKFDKDGGFLAKWGSLGATEGDFYYPLGIAVDEDGYVYVGDRDNHRVQKFDGSGTFQRMWGWGVDTGAAQFEVCTSACMVGLSGSGDGQFNNAVGVAVDAHGDIYVVDQVNHRVQKFTSDGVFLVKWGSLGSGDGQFKQPVGIAIGPLGDIYVGDQVNQRIQRFKGSPLSYYKAEPVPSLDF
jgi:DNA-binding beta-propeller fold protein YncE